MKNRIFKLLREPSVCPKCKSRDVDGDNLNTWCNTCGYFWN